jgi:hypothetical protein
MLKFKIKLKMSHMDQLTTPEHRVFYEGILRSFQYALEVADMCATYSAHSGRDKMCPADVLLANCFFCPVFAHALETRDPSYADDTLETILARARAAKPPTTGYRESPEAFVASTCRCTVCAGMNAADPAFQPRTRFETLLWAVGQRSSPQADLDLKTAPPTPDDRHRMCRDLDAMVEIVAQHVCGGVAPFHMRVEFY